MNSNEGRQSQLLQQRQHLRPQRRCQQLRTRRPSHLQRPLEGDTLSLVGQIQQKSKLQQHDFKLTITIMIAGLFDDD